MSQQQQLLWITGGLGFITIIGVIYVLKKQGFGPSAIKAWAVTLIAVFATLLAVSNNNALTPAMTLLGAIAGYAFGAKDKKPTEQ